METAEVARKIVLSEGLLDAGSVVAAIDEAAGEDVVVTGALPPQGRDLDLLVNDEQARRLPQVLAARGFLPRGRKVAPRRSASKQWVMIEGCSALAVDLNPVRRWGLPPGEERALVADAVPIEGFRHLVRPSSYHTILILARRLATGSLSSHRLDKLAAAIDADPLAWERAQERAGAWGVRAAVPALRRMYEQGLPPTRTQRARALAGVTRAAGVHSAVARAGGKLAAAMPRRARVVGFSGLDGSGKSSQVRALTSMLEQLDVAVVAEWKPLGHNASIRAVRRVIKRAYARLRGLDAKQLDELKRPGRSLIAGANPALLGGRQNAALTHIWSTLVCLASAGHYRMVALRHAGSGRLIIFDRYALDTTAQLRFFYGPEHRFGLQRALIRILCPVPIAAWLLDVPGEVALARKPEQYDLPQLKQQETLLREEAARLGVTRLDGTRPMTELCQHIATQIWERMNH
jgi:thymidylate kinase